MKQLKIMKILNKSLESIPPSNSFPLKTFSFPIKKLKKKAKQ